MARFSDAVALFIVADESSAVCNDAAAAVVLLCWTWSVARLAPVGLDRYTTASGRSASISARKAPAGWPVAVLIVLAWERVRAPRTVRNVANAYRAISESTGTRTRRKIRWRMDRRRSNPMAQASKCEWNGIVTT